MKKMNSCDCILESKDGKGGLYLGNVDAATNLEFLKNNNIRAVISLIGYHKYPSDVLDGHLYFAIEDSPRSNLKKHFFECYKFLEQYL